MVKYSKGSPLQMLEAQLYGIPQVATSHSSGMPAQEYWQGTVSMKNIMKKIEEYRRKGTRKNWYILSSKWRREIAV